MASPAIYCGARPLCEAVVNKIGFPCLALDCSKSLIASCANPLYVKADALFGVDAHAAKAPHGGPMKPIVVYTVREVKSMDAFKAAFPPWAEKCQASPGVRAFFSFEDKTKASTIFLVAWFDDAAALAGLSADPKVAKSLVPGGMGAVYGDRSETVKEALSFFGMATHWEFGSLPRGFLKSPPHEGFASSGPPMIWISKRWVRPGRMEASASAFAKAGALQYYAAPKMLGSFEYTADSNPDQLWSLRFFNDYEMGHVAHFPKTVCSFIPPRVLFTVVPELKGGLGAEFPVAISISTKSDIEKAIAYNPGNKAYTQYYWADVIGPVPNMSKGNAAHVMER